MPEDDGDDRRGRSDVRRMDAPIGREWRSYCLRRYSVTTRHRPAESSSSQRKVDSHDVRSFMLASIRLLVSAVDVPLSNLIARCWEGGGGGRHSGGSGGGWQRRRPRKPW